MTRELRAQHFQDGSGNPLRGVTEGPGMRIEWEGTENPEGAKPVELLKAVANRLQHLKGTKRGDNYNAQRIWIAEEAIRKFEEVDGQERDSSNGLGSAAPVARS